MRAFDVALQNGEDEFVKKRIYLTLERGRDIALRNLLRKVYIAGGYDEAKEGETTPVRRTRIPVEEFRVAVCMGSGGELVDTDEVECLLANMIYKVSPRIYHVTEGNGAVDTQLCWVQELQLGLRLATHVQQLELYSSRCQPIHLDSLLLASSPLTQP